MQLIRGAIIAIGAGIVSYIIVGFIPALDALFLALILGILIGGLLPANLKTSVGNATLPLITAGIVLYSSNLDFSCFKGEFIPKILKVLIVQAVFFLSIIYMSRKLGMDRRLSVLIASGSAVCGASAIAVISPLVKARKGETSTAIMVITAVGLTGALIYPIFKTLLSLPPEIYSFIAGTTLHQVALVKIACINANLNPEHALFYKGIRIATLVIFAVVAQYMTDWDKPEIPWFIIAFVALGVAFSFVEAFKGIRQYVQPISAVIFASALASIGMTVDIGEVFEARLRALNTAYAGWIIALLVALMVGVIV